MSTRTLWIWLVVCIVGCGDDKNGGNGNGDSFHPPVGTAFLYNSAIDNSGMYLVDTLEWVAGEVWIRPISEPGVSRDGTRLAWYTRDQYGVNNKVQVDPVLPGGNLGETICEFPIGVKFFDYLEFGPDRRRFIGHEAGNWQYFDCETMSHVELPSKVGEMGWSYQSKAGAIWSPDGRHFAIWEERGRLILYEQGNVVWTLAYGPAEPWLDDGDYPRATFSPNGEWVALALHHTTLGNIQWDGLRFYHIPSRTFTKVFAATADITELRHPLPVHWLPDSSGVVIFFDQLHYIGVHNDCYRDQVPHPLTVFRLEESIAQGQDVIQELEVDDGSFSKDQCSAWEFLAPMPDGESLLYHIDRLDEVDDPINPERVIKVIERQWRIAKLDGSGHELLACHVAEDFYDNAPGSRRIVGFKGFGWHNTARLYNGTVHLGEVIEHGLSAEGRCGSTWHVIYRECAEMGAELSPDLAYCGSYGALGFMGEPMLEGPEPFSVPLHVDQGEGYMYAWR